MQQNTPYQQTSSLALVSLVAGILGISIAPLLGSIIAVVTGHMARREIAASGGQLSGDGLAVAGLVLGYFVIISSVLAACLIAALALFGISIPLCFLPFANQTGALLSLFLSL